MTNANKNPENNVYSLYSDGNYFPRAKKSGFGGYIEDSSGMILVEYTEQIKQPDYIHNFELLGIIRGLQLAQIMGVKDIVSYCDDKTTMLRMNEIMQNKEKLDKLPLYAKPELFLQIYDLTQHFNSIRFQYIARSENKHSDMLSRRYSVLLEKNFSRQYEDDLMYAEESLKNNQKPSKRIFFSHPNLIKMKDKNNPFLVAPIRNRRSRKIARIEKEELNSYQYLFLELVQRNEEDYSLLVFHYPKGKDGEKILMNTIEQAQDLDIDILCQILSNSIESVSFNNNQPLWIYSNVGRLNKYLEQKEKIPKASFNSFQQIFEVFNLSSKIMYHYLPFKHEFSPEIALKEAKKDSLAEDLECIDLLMEQLQKGVLEREQNKYFGKLIRYQLRSYRKILARELDEVEKRDVIKKTTHQLESYGLKNLPKI